APGARHHPEGRCRMSGEITEKTAGEVSPSVVGDDPRPTDERSHPLVRLFAGGFGRNLGLVIALLLLCVVGFATAGDRFASTDNLMTILRLGSVIGVVS